MAAIRLSASFVLVPEQSAVKYSKYAASRDAESASASPGVNSKTFRSFTRRFATSPFGAPQQSSYFFPEPHPQGALCPVLLPIVPSGSEIVTLSPRPANNPDDSRERPCGDHGRSTDVFS